MGHTCKIGSHLEEWVTLGKWVTLRKMGHTWKNASHLNLNGSHFKKWVTLGKMGQTFKNGSQWKK